MKWKLENLFPTVKDWENAYETLKNNIEKMGNFKGKLGNFDDFKNYYTLQRDVATSAHKLYQYAALKSDLNRKDVENAGRVQKVGYLLNELSKATSFESPEIVGLGKDKVMGFIDSDKSLEE